MKKDIGEHIISKLDLPDIVKILSDELSGSELNTILLEVFNRRIQQETPSSLLNKYEGNKLVKPANIDVLRYKEQELTCYKVLASRGFEPIEHSPAAQLGTSSVVVREFGAQLGIITGALGLPKPNEAENLPQYWYEEFREQVLLTINKKLKLLKEE